MASLHRRGKKGTWWIKYRVGPRQVFHSLNTTSERVALRIKREVEGDEAKGELVAPSRTPLDRFLQAFCEFLSTVRTKKSYKNDLSVLRVFFGPRCAALEPQSTVNRRFQSKSPRKAPDQLSHLHVGGTYLEDITPAVIDGFVTRRIREDGIAPKTANRTREVLHRMFQYAIRNWGFVAPDRRYPNPAAAVDRRREAARTIRFLQLSEIDQQLQVLKERPTIRAIVATLIYAGLRREEVIWLQPADVDLDQRLIYVRAKTVGGEFWQPKTKRNRVVPVSGRLHELLCGYEAPDGQLWQFPSPTVKRWDPDNFSQDLREINQSHGLPWSCLDYRHTFGSQLAQKGESLYKIAELMGNSPEICRRHYAALVPEKMHDVVQFSRREELDLGGQSVGRAVPAAPNRCRDDQGPPLRLVR